MKPGTPLAAAVLVCIAVSACPLASARELRATAGDLRCGAASVDFQADDSMVIAGGIGPGGATGQEGRLRAAAVVIGLGDARLALVACDILMMRRDHLDAAARRIEKETGIPFENILINATHTHHAPSTVTVHDYGRDASFCAHVRECVVKAVRKAAERLETSSGVEMRFRLGQESTVGENSRVLLSDGTVWWTGKANDEIRPTGPFDPELPVMSFRRPGGAIEAIIFNHSSHLIGTERPGVRSPSFYGLAAQKLEKDLGGQVLFVSGAFGSTHNRRLSCSEMTRRIEWAVRDALGRSAPRKVGILASIRREFTYRVRNFDEEKEDKAVAHYCRKRLGKGADYVIGVFRKMRRELAGKQGEERRTWLQAMRVGDIAWVALPGEVFTALGIEIKRRSPFRYTYVAGVANDYIGYIPDDESYDLGGYQVWTGLHSFVARGTGEAIVREAVKMLEELRAESEQERRDERGGG